jgi:hypothetical protein|tara:strand:- start:449 stop:622 length:174 start_codon:yes stop_codon:yes gene_type:complete
MIKTLKRLLNNVKEQSLNVPGYKAKKILKVYIYIGYVAIFGPLLYLLIIFIFNSLSE